ncbi:hypothetical protein Tco_0429828 [Tanacetum coccineum]
MYATTRDTTQMKNSPPHSPSAANYSLSLANPLLLFNFSHTWTHQDQELELLIPSESLKTEKSSGENLVPIPSESKGISDDICDVLFCDNDHFDAEFGLINSLLSRDIR